MLPWWLNVKESTCQCSRCSFNAWVGKIPWGRTWQPISAFLLGKSHRQRSLVGYSPWGHKGSYTAAWLNNNIQHTHRHSSVSTNTCWTTITWVSVVTTGDIEVNKTQLSKAKTMGRRGRDVQMKRGEEFISFRTRWKQHSRILSISCLTSRYVIVAVSH